MLNKEKIFARSRACIKVTGLGAYSLSDTLECGQAFRYEKITDEGKYVEYMTVVGENIITVGQEVAGELLFYTDDDELFDSVIVPYFTLTTDYEAIRADIVSKTDSEWLMRAAESAKGVAILKQDHWEALFSFIISQNNNIPRIRKIIKRLCAEYGENLAVKSGCKSCPLNKFDGEPCDEKCRECGCCYSFPTAKGVRERPEGLLTANPGFRYRYLLCAAEMVDTKQIDLDMIDSLHSYDKTLEELKRIVGVGDKVASCVALFGFANLEAFPIDVWMKRAIDEYFEGRLDHKALGQYAGIAQQYIFHYIRNLSSD